MLKEIIKLRIATSSDIHNKYWPEFEEADVLIFAGDFTECSPNDVMSQVLQFNTSMSELLSQAHKFKQIFIVFGNHDTFADAKPHHPEIKKWERVFRENGTRLNFLTNEIVKYRGVSFLGNPYNMPVGESRKENDDITKYNSPWAFHWTSNRQGKTYSLLNNSKADVIITHAPSRGILDQNQNGIPCGEYRFHQYLDDHRPKLWVFGHIHESYGQKQIGETLYVNAALSKSHHFSDDGTMNPVQYIDMEFEKEKKQGVFPIEIYGDIYTEKGGSIYKGDEVVNKQDFWNLYKGSK